MYLVINILYNKRMQARWTFRLANLILFGRIYYSQANKNLTNKKRIKLLWQEQN